MGREVRHVTADWAPHDEPLFDGLKYPANLEQWLRAEKLWAEGKVEQYDGTLKPKPADIDDYSAWDGPRPDPADYTTTRPGDDLTHIVMYEDTTEGTPISPKFPATPEGEEELATWLANNNASSFGGWTASKEQWLGMIRDTGYSFGMAIVDGHVMSGVEFAAIEDEK